MTQKLKEVKEKIADGLDFRKFSEELIGDPPEASHTNHGDTELEFICPFHDDTEASFNFNVDRGVYYCFGCGESGDWIDLYMELEGRKFWPAINELGNRVGVNVPEEMPDPSLTLREYAEAKDLDLELLKDLGLEDGSWYGNDAVRVPYWDQGGNLFRTRCRLSLYKRDGKDSRFKWYGDGEGQTLYGLWKLPDYEDKVLLVEGESDCHTMWNVWPDAPVLGVPGKSNLENFPDDWIEYLRDFEEIILLQENDAEDAVKSAAATIAGETEADVYILDLPTDDVSDLYQTNREKFKDLWNEAVENKEKFDPAKYKKAKLELENQSGEEETSSEDDEPTIHQKLLQIADQADLFKTANNRMFAEVTEDGKPYVFEIMQKGASGGNFRHWLIRNYKRRYGEGPNASGVSRTMEAVRADCAIAEEREVYKRIADLGDRILVDLAGDQRRAVEVTSEGYKVVEDPKVNFWRPDGARELPEPKGSVEDLEYLRDLINIEAEDFSLLIAWLLATFQTAGPYPVLIPTGPAGSGKSTLTKIIRNLLDPAGKSGRATTRSVQKSEDLFSVAKHRHLLALDNISRLRQWQSDALSAISTGGGLEKRKLYSDDSLSTIDTMNPIVMNGIDISGIGDDLLDRAIFLHLEEPTERVEEKTIWEKFERNHGKILGGLCDALTTTLANRNEVTLSQVEMTRMADFTRWVKAAKPAIQKVEGLEDIDPLDNYHDNRSSAGRDALLESELGSTLVEFLESQEPDDNGVLWVGKTSELLEELEDRTSEKAINSKNWPGSAVPLGKRLTRIKTTLEKIGIVLEKVDDRRGTVNKFYEEVPF